MAQDSENLTLRVLRELRAEMRDARSDMNARFDDLGTRVDGNTMILNLIAGMLHDQEERITTLEAR